MSHPTQEWRFEVGSTDEGERIDRLLARRMPFLSRSRLQRLFVKRRVLIYQDWKRHSEPREAKRPSCRVRAGQLVIAHIDAPFADGDSDQAPQTLAAERVLFNDDHLIAVDKPAGCAVHPSRRHLQDSLIEQVHRYQSSSGDTAPATPCHRLDLATSGIVLFAKTASARAAMGALFEQHTTQELEKNYLAIVHGQPDPPKGTIELALGQDQTSPISVRHWVDPKGKPARTQYETVRVLDKPQRTVLRLTPATGRKHQLRVHMAAIGHPILGDALYTADSELFLRSTIPAGETTNTLTADDRTVLGCERLALHAERLSFTHPETGVAVHIEAAIPPDLAYLLGPSATRSDRC